MGYFLWTRDARSAVSKEESQRTEGQAGWAFGPHFTARKHVSGVPCVACQMEVQFVEKCFGIILALWYNISSTKGVE